jgi:probable rRNA maturation factor
MSVDVEVGTGVTDVPARAEFRRWVALAASAFELPNAEVAVRVVGETEGASLNQQWRGRPGATNVLSFPAGEMPQASGRRRHLGDLVLCAPVLRREAAAQGKLEAHHWAHLTVHGTLHLLGLDHQHADEATAMESLEIRLLASLDIPNPYEEALAQPVRQTSRTQERCER